MSIEASTLVFWALCAVALIGAIAVVFVREVMRMALGLGAFLMAVAGLFAYYGFGFLALAELFVYVGGVLVLILFAIMLVQRTGAGAPQLESRIDVLNVVAALAVAGGIGSMLLPLAAEFGPVAAAGGPKLLAETLLGRLPPQFEAVGVLLLASLVAVVVIAGGDRE